MTTDAILLIGRLLSNEEIIEEVVFKKKGFRVRFKKSKTLFHFKYTEISIESFLEYYEAFEILN